MRFGTVTERVFRSFIVPLLMALVRAAGASSATRTVQPARSGVGGPTASGRSAGPAGSGGAAAQRHRGCRRGRPPGIGGGPPGDAAGMGGGGAGVAGSGVAATHGCRRRRGSVRPVPAAARSYVRVRGAAHPGLEISRAAWSGRTWPSVDQVSDGLSRLPCSTAATRCSPRAGRCRDQTIHPATGESTKRQSPRSGACLQSPPRRLSTVRARRSGGCKSSVDPTAAPSGAVP